MGVGNFIFGPNRLLRSNAVVDVEKGVPAYAGGTTYTWSAVASSVDVLLTQAAGGRELQTGTYNERATYSVAGIAPSLARPDVRLKVTAAGAGLSDLVGRYLSVRSGQPHPAGSGGLLGARVNLTAEVLEVPGDAGTAL